MSRNHIDPKDHESFVGQTFVKLKKFKMVTTGCAALDSQVRLFFGEWLTPSEEYSAICREISVAEAIGDQERIAVFKARKVERLRKGIADPVTPTIESSYEIVGRKIFMRTKPVTDSGIYRITYVKRYEKYSVVDEVSEKKIREFDSGELLHWLGYFFNRNEVTYLYAELWRDK